MNRRTMQTLLVASGLALLVGTAEAAPPAGVRGGLSSPGAERQERNDPGSARSTNRSRDNNRLNGRQWQQHRGSSHGPNQNGSSIHQGGGGRPGSNCMSC